MDIQIGKCPPSPATANASLDTKIITQLWLEWALCFYSCLSPENVCHFREILHRLMTHQKSVENIHYVHHVCHKIPAAYSADVSRAWSKALNLSCVVPQKTIVCGFFRAVDEQYLKRLHLSLLCSKNNVNVSVDSFMRVAFPRVNFQSPCWLRSAAAQ